MRIFEIENEIDVVLTEYVEPPRTQRKRDRLGPVLERLGRELFDTLKNDMASEHPLEEMNLSLRKIAERGNKLHGLRADILDKRWDGIGDEIAVWTA